MKKTKYLRIFLFTTSTLLLLFTLIIFIYVPSTNKAAANTSEINVIDFGAAGDGITDDHEAIQNAINYAYANDIVLVKIPAGRYLIKDTITIPDNITLAGVLHDKPTLVQHEATYRMLQNHDLDNGNHNIGFKNIIFDGNRVIGGTPVFQGSWGLGGFVFYNTKGITLENVTIKNFFGSEQEPIDPGLKTRHAKFSIARFYSCEDVIIVNCHLKNAGYYGLDFVDGARNVQIKNSIFDGMHNTAVMFRGANYSEELVFCENILFEGNTVKNIGGSNFTPDGAFDIYHLGKDVRVINNIFYNCGETINGKHYGSAIRLTSTIGALVENNIVIYNGISAFDAIRTSGRESFFGSEDIVINNNKVTMKNGAELRHRGISVVDHGPLSSNITINNNEIFVDATSYIRIAYYIAGSDISLTENRLIYKGSVDSFISTGKTSNEFIENNEVEDRQEVPEPPQPDQEEITLLWLALLASLIILGFFIMLAKKRRMKRN